MAEEEIELKCTIELMGKPKEAVIDSLKKILSNVEENGKKLEIKDCKIIQGNICRDG